MKQITPSDTRYIPLTQQRYCCVPTCIQIIMLKHNIPLVPAEVIGYEMGLIIPKDELKLFWNARTGPKPPAGYGTQAGKPQYGPNRVFKKLKIPLKMKWSLINKFKNIDEFRDYLSSVERDDKDVLVCYDWGILFDDEYHGGHLCVLDRIYLTKGEVRIIDPEYKASKWRVVKIDKLYEAMKYHGEDKSGGFWELTQTWLA